MSKNEQKLQTDDEFGVLTAEEIKLMKRGFWGETRSPPVSLRQLTQEACGFFFCSVTSHRRRTKKNICM